MSAAVLTADQQAAIIRYRRDYEMAGMGNPARAASRADSLRRARAILTPAMRAVMDFAAQGHTPAVIAQKSGAKVADLETLFLVAANRLVDFYAAETEHDL